MGKAGKARKKRILESAFGERVAHGVSAEQPSSEEDARDPPITSESHQTEIAASIHMLNTLSRRLDVYSSKAMKAARTALFPLIQLQLKKGAHFEAPVWEGPVPDDKQVQVLLHPRNVQQLAKVAGRMAATTQAFLSPESKAFRAALHPLVMEQRRRNTPGALLPVAPAAGAAEPLDADRSHSARVSAAFRQRDWARVWHELVEMQHSGEPPKLGALQRWVRDCDLAIHDPKLAKGVDKDGSNMSFLLLDAVMRVANKAAKVNLTASVGQEHAHEQPAVKSTSLMPDRAVVHRHPPFSVTPPEAWTHPSRFTELSCSDKEAIKKSVHVVSHIPGPQRRPPSEHDHFIYQTSPAHIRFSPDDAKPQPARHDVPGVPGAFLMTNILTRDECTQILRTAEAIGYAPDAVDGIDNIIWLADDSLLGPVFERCKPLMPSRMSDCALRGINARMRLFRYYPGSVYRPHIDGAWPGSGLDPKTGKVLDDAFGRDRYSKLTFLMYLNGGFDGGATTFFLPSAQGVGHVDAFCVRPAAGCVLCFPHGDAEGSLVHEGSNVEEGGVKYIIRTDVLYATSPSS